ncbi:hypothetical protein Tco_0585168 [Tanacetum coccineum]
MSSLVEVHRWMQDAQLFIGTSRSDDGIDQAGSGVVSLLKRISKKRTKNEAKTTKPGTEWKSVEKTKTRQSPSVKKSTKAPPAVVEPFNLEEPFENPPPPPPPMDDQRTMAQLLEAPTAGYEDAIVYPLWAFFRRLQHRL